MFARLTVACLLLAPALARAETPSRPPFPPGFNPTPPALTPLDVERLIVLIPELARASGALPATAPGSPGATVGGAPPVEQLEKLEALLKKHDYTFPDFVLQLNALVATYIALAPEELDRQLPSEETPQVRQLLDDPAVPEAQKQEVRKQIAAVRANKDLIRQQIVAFATEENKRVVKPMLPRIKEAFATAEREGRRARGESPGADKGPRRGKSPP